MADPRHPLQRAAVAEATLADALTLAFVRELEQVLKLLNAQIKALLLQMAREDGRLVSTEANLGRALELRRSLIRAIEDAGYPQAAERALDAPLDRLSDKILASDTVAGAAARLTPFDIDAIAAFKELRLAQLLDLGTEIAGNVWRAVLDGVLGVRPVDDLVEDIADLIEKSAAQARTIYDTAVSTFSRQVDQLRATGEPDELFVYAGPADSAMRPFCRERVGKVFSRLEVEGMDNGQLPNVLLTGGGYNCRHAFKRVSLLDEELRDLHGTGDRLPEIEQQLEEATA